MVKQKKPSFYSKAQLRTLIKEQKILVVGVILPILVIIVAILLGLLVMQKNNPQTKTLSSPTTFKDWLKPASELKVGDFRYVSACQVLPLANIVAIFGKTDSKSYIQEDAFTVSVPKSEYDNTIHTRCVYNLPSGAVELGTEQHTSTESLKDVSTLVLVADEAKLTDTIANLKKKVDGSNNQEAKNLVNDMEKSLTKYQKYNDEFDDAALAKVSFNGLVLPTFLNELQVVYNNVVYTISSAKLDKASVDDLAKLDKAIKVIAQNAQDKQLNQSPASTVIGTRDTIGSTKILEPCALISSSIFKAVTGTDENDGLLRVTLPLDSNRDIIDQKVSKRIIFSNECTRNSDSGDSKASFDMQLYQAKNVAYAQQYAKDYDDDPTSSPTAVTTNADEAFLYPNSNDPSSPSYLFRVGAYVGILSIETSASKSLADDITFTSATQEQYVQAINLLTEQIKVDSK